MAQPKMPDTLVRSEDMAGAGVVDFGTEIAYTYALVHVTDPGYSRQMDVDDPQRLFQFGWFTLGSPGPGAWDYTGEKAWSRVIWIDFANMVIPDLTTLDFTKEVYAAFLGYQMVGPATANISFWHV